MSSIAILFSVFCAIGNNSEIFTIGTIIALIGLLVQIFTIGTIIALIAGDFLTIDG